MSARISRTLRQSASGAVEPHSRLMLKPSGSTPIEITSAPSSQSALGRDPVGGAVGAIDDDAQAFERKVARQRALGEFDVAVVHAVDALGAAEVAALRQTLGHVAVDQSLRSRRSTSSESL